MIAPIVLRLHPCVIPSEATGPWSHGREVAAMTLTDRRGETDRSNKNDFRDAEAIAEAVTRPTRVWL